MTCTIDTLRTQCIVLFGIFLCRCASLFKGVYEHYHSTWLAWAHLETLTWEQSTSNIWSKVKCHFGEDRGRMHEAYGESMETLQVSVMI